LNSPRPGGGRPLLTQACLGVLLFRVIP
jgi:hypothetical protein